MFRSVTAIFALLILPSLAATQEIRPGEQGTHVVVKGNTLWDLAAHYLGNPFLWPLIYEANQDEIRDPHWIYPGQVFLIPGLAGARRQAQPPARVPVEDIAVVSPTEQPPEGPVPEAAPCPARGDRTVFWDGEGGDRGCVLPIPAPEERTAFYVDPETAVVGGSRTSHFEALYAVPRGIFYATPWLEGLEAEVPGVGTLSRFSGVDKDASPRDRAHFFERLQVQVDRGVELEVGDLLQAFEIGRAESGLGQVVRPTGILAVTAVEEAGVVAMVSAEFLRVRLGQRLRMAPSYDLSPGIRAEEVESDLYATLMGFDRTLEIHSIGSVAFIDVGETEGIKPGDEFSAYVNRGDGWSGEEAARLQVVLVDGSVSSVRIVTVTDPSLGVGSRLHLVKKMQ